MNVVVTPQLGAERWQEAIRLRGPGMSRRSEDRLRRVIELSGGPLLELLHGRHTAAAVLPRVAAALLRDGHSLLCAPSSLADLHPLDQTSGRVLVDVLVPSPRPEQAAQPLFGRAILKLKPELAELASAWADWATVDEGIGVGAHSPFSWWAWLVGDPRMRVTASSTTWADSNTPDATPPADWCSAVADAFRAGLRMQLRGRPDDHLPHAHTTTAHEIEQFLSAEPADLSGSHAVLACWYARPDLQAAFPHPTSTDRLALLDWCHNQALSELGTPPKWFPKRPQPGRLAPARRGRSKVQRVALVRIAATGKGISEAATILNEQLVAQGYDVEELIYRPGEQHEVLQADIVVFAINGDHLESAVAHVRAADRVPFVAWWWYETEPVPDRYIKASDSVDRVLAPTTLVDAVLRPRLGGRVVRAPLPLRKLPEVHRRAEARQSFGLGNDTTVYLTQADGNSSLWRKNTRGVVTAFLASHQEALPHKALLWVKVQHLAAWPEEAAWLRTVAEQRQDIALFEQVFTDAEQAEVFDAVDVYVSAHRSEGLGLGILEALSRGLLVMATGYGGFRDIVDGSGALLLNFQLVRQHDPSGVYEGLGLWADPDLEQLAGLMARRTSDPSSFRALAQRGPSSLRDASSDQGWEETFAALSRSRRRVRAPRSP